MGSTSVFFAARRAAKKTFYTPPSLVGLMPIDYHTRIRLDFETLLSIFNSLYQTDNPCLKNPIFDPS
jgi:hypothetical protein